MDKFRIAAVQLDVGGSSAAITKRIISHIENLAGSASIICFPECSLAGGPVKNEEYLARVQEACKKAKVWCIVGGNLRVKGKIHNMAVLIDDHGKIQGGHAKVHICDPSHVSPGGGFKVFKTPFCTIGIAICWDIHHPEALYTLARKGAKVIFCPMSWNYDLWAHERNHGVYEKKILTSLLLTRAFENRCYVVFCNPYLMGHDPLVTYTAIAEPHHVITSVYGRPGVVSATIDLRMLEKIRKRYAKEYSLGNS